MKTLLSITTALLTLASAAFAKDLVNVNWSGVAIKGYDPVAYFTDGKPVKGDAQFQSTYQGAIYEFASAAHRAAFDKAPAKYAPQFGGFCAYAVSQGHTASISPEAFQIVDGRLLLQYDLGVRDKFNQDTAANLKKADANWPGLAEAKGK
jgi:YHS domain-containing protein